MTRGQKREYIPTLDGWRTIAIAAVLLCHGFTLADTVTGRERAISEFALHLGPQGVSLFFAISGYLITTLLLNEKDRLGAIPLRSFYIRRVFRILPPAYVYLGAIVLLATLGLLRSPLQPGEIASSVFMYNNYFEPKSWYTSHFWSLSVEEHFYLLWPSTLALLGVARARWFAVALIVATAIWRPWAMVHLDLSYPILQRTDLQLDAFLFAGLLAIALHGDGKDRLTRLISSPRFSWVGFRWVAIAALGLAYALGGQATRALVRSALLPLIVVSTVFTPRSPLSRFLETRLMRWLGRISYSLYLWQQLILSGDAPSLRAAAIAFPPKLALIVIVATGSYYWIERPLIRFGRKLAERS